MEEQKRLEILVESLKIDSDCELITTIIEHIGNVQVQEIDKRDNEFEVFMKPSSFTARELDNIRQNFNLKEIGIYGDPNLPEDTVYLHMIVEIK